MIRRVVVVGFGLIVVGLCGCGNSPDSLMRSQIKLMSEMANALENNAPQSKLDQIDARMTANAEKMRELKLTEDDHKKLLEKHKDEYDKASLRLMTAVWKRSSPDGKIDLPF